MQLINRHFGGRIQHGISDHIGRTHSLKSDSCVELNEAVTNSFHGDGIPVQDVAECLTVIALSEDGMVEAFTKSELNILGVQWHPERQSKQFDDTIIEKLFRDKRCPQN